MNKPSLPWLAAVLVLPAYAQPSPTQPGVPDPGGARPVPADDCRRQADLMREQFQVQESAIRREIAERERLATTDGERQRLRTELQQRLASLRLQAAEAQRRVQESCRSG